MVTATKPDDEAASSQPAANALRFGRYAVLSRVGEGAMGIVYSAYDEVLERRVAVKLVRRRMSDDPLARARVLREAQALAQLSHPNVIQVHDVGEWNNHIFIALEFVHGRTLTTWLKEQERSWSDIVAVFVQAGRGLAAAHAAGIVHRDVKPDNFMIGSDGRVRVMDFGLALPLGNGDEGEPGATLSQSGRSLVRVTAAGTLIGTPAYMAPEQFLREPTDARTDQFGFCVALFESLWGSRPFTGDTIEAITRSVLLGDMIAPPARTPVPPRIHRALARGLATEPGQRFPNMPALLAELEPPPERGRRRLRWTVALAGLVVAGVVALRIQTAGTCRNAGEHLVGVWDEARAATIERALLATRLEFAGDTATRVRGALDRYAADWAALHTSTCEAHRDGERSSAALDLQMHCLQRRRAELDALVDVLAEVDADTAMNATQAVAGLQPVAACDDPAALMDEQRRLGLPADPAAATQIQLLRRKLAQVEALYLAGRLVRGLELVDAVLRAAQAIEYLPTLAEAQFWRGRLLAEVGPMDEAASALWSAYLTGIRAGHEAIELRALATDVYVQGYGLQAFATADRSASVARALLARPGSDQAHEAELLLNLATARQAAGRQHEAEALYRASLVLRRPHSLEFGITVMNLGDALRDQGRLAEAEAALLEALAVLERNLGARHPYVQSVQANLALVYFDGDRHVEAADLLEPALPHLVAAFGPDRPDLAELFAARGTLRLGRGELVRAFDDLNHAGDIAERSGLPLWRMHARFALARALWDHEPAQRTRALTLARQAARDAAAAPDPRRGREIAAWIAAHAPE